MFGASSRSPSGFHKLLLCAFRRRTHPRPRQAAERQAGSERMPILLVFGDSWANSADHIHTWPELLARHWGWRLINLALPHSGSDALHVQMRDLCHLLAGHPGTTLGAEDLAIIHTGGNDLYYSQPSSLAAVAITGPFASVFAPHIGRSLSYNVQTLSIGLLNLGVRHIVCCGVPLSVKMPFIAKPVAELGVARLAMCLARCVMRSSNHTLLTAMRTGLTDGQRASGTRLRTAYCINEASAIDRVIDADPGREECGWWEDQSHPSQALHAALAELLQIELRGVLEGSRSLLTPLPPPNKPSPDGRTLQCTGIVDDEDVTVSLMPTPKEREAVS